MRVFLLDLSKSWAPAFQIDFILGRPQKQMQISFQACYLGHAETSEMGKLQGEMPSNLSSSYATVVNFIVFMTKVCLCLLFFHWNELQFSMKESSCSILFRGEKKPAATEQLQMLLQSPSCRSEDTWWVKPAAGFCRIPMPAAFLPFWQR